MNQLNLSQERYVYEIPGNSQYGFVSFKRYYLFDIIGENYKLS